MHEYFSCNPGTSVVVSGEGVRGSTALGVVADGEDGVVGVKRTHRPHCCSGASLAASVDCGALVDLHWTMAR